MAPAMSAASVLPGPRPAPLIGWRGNATAFYHDPLGYVGNVHQRYGEIAALVRADPSFVFVLGPAAYQQMLDQPALFASPLRLSDPTSERLFHTPLQLAPDALERHGRTVVALTEQMLDRWGVGRLVDVAYVMQRLTLRIVALTLLGIEQPGELAQADATIRHWTDSLFARPATHVPIHAPLWRTQQQAGAVQRLIEAALTRRHTTSAAPTHGAYDLLDALLPAAASNDPASIALAVEQAARLLVVGSELTAAALGWTLFLLSQHPMILADLVADLRGASPIAAALTADRAAPSLLERVLYESLRLLPPQSLDLRRCSVAATLGAYDLPAGALVVACPYVTQRTPEVYFAPHKFRPERWLYIDPSPAEFAPFGGGLDSGLSTDLALAQLKIILTTLLQRYRLALAPGVRIDRAARLTLVPKTGLPMIITHADRPMIKREAHGNIREMVALG